MHILYAKEFVMQAIDSVYMIAREVGPMAARDFKIPHRGLLPRRIIGVQKVLGLAEIMLPLTLAGAAAAMFETAVSAFAMNMPIGAGALLYLNITQIPEPEYFIFPGLGLLSDPAMQISSDFPRHKI